jgi:glycosyltransferase involved in cell wall biosynthesis
MQNQESLISIIVPTYNRAHLLIKTLNTINDQSYKNWECIIVDDQSTDNTIEILENYIIENKRFRFYIRPPDLPKGVNSCRKEGFLKSKGDYISWFDSDDLKNSYTIKRRGC